MSCCNLIMLAYTLSSGINPFQIPYSYEEFGYIDPMNWISDKSIRMFPIPDFNYKYITNYFQCRDCYIENLRLINSQGALVFRRKAKKGFINMENIQANNIYFNCRKCDYTANNITQTKKLKWKMDNIFINMEFSFKRNDNHCLISSDSIKFLNQSLHYDFIKNDYAWIKSVIESYNDDIKNVFSRYIIEIIQNLTALVKGNQDKTCSKFYHVVERLINQKVDLCN